MADFVHVTNPHDRWTTSQADSPRCQMRGECRNTAHGETPLMGEGVGGKPGTATQLAQCRPWIRNDQRHRAKPCALARAGFKRRSRPSSSKPKGRSLPKSPTQPPKARSPSPQPAIHTEADAGAAGTRQASRPQQAQPLAAKKIDLLRPVSGSAAAVLAGW